MYKRFQAIDERDKRIYMAGMSLTQLIGFENAQEFCKNTVLAIGDLDTDEMIYFSNSIDRDVEHVDQGHAARFSDYFTASVSVYVDEGYLEDARDFFDSEELIDNFESGRMTDSIEYHCTAGGVGVWIRACYELKQDEETGHIIATVALIDITGLRENLRHYAVK